MTYTPTYNPDYPADLVTPIEDLQAIHDAAAAYKANRTHHNARKLFHLMGGGHPNLCKGVFAPDVNDAIAAAGLHWVTMCCAADAHINRKIPVPRLVYL